MDRMTFWLVNLASNSYEIDILFGNAYIMFRYALLLSQYSVN